MNQIDIELKSPLLLVIEITNLCNLSCLYCYSRKSRLSISKIDLPTFRKIVKEAKEMEIFDINLSGGEPFLHKNILDFIEIIVNNGFGISIVTNGTVIDSKMAQKLAEFNIIPYVQVSFDSSIPSIHNKTRGKFHLSLEGFMNMVEYAENKMDGPSIGIVINKFNFKYLPETIDFFSKYTNRFHLMNVMGHPELSLDIEEMKYFESIILQEIVEIAEEKDLIISNHRYREHYNEVKFKAQNLHIDCLAGLTTLVISPNLDVFPCDIGRYFLGNLKQDSLKNIYNKSKSLWKQRTKPWCEK